MIIDKLGPNPVVMTAAGDAYTVPCRVLAIIWSSASTSGDTVTLNKRGDEQSLLWPGRTSDTQTYQGVNFGPWGIHCPEGFVLNAISSGTLAVYLAER